MVRRHLSSAGSCELGEVQVSRAMRLCQEMNSFLRMKYLVLLKLRTDGEIVIQGRSCLSSQHPESIPYYMSCKL